VSVAPVLAGTGTRVKIVEAFAWGLPVVSTAVGAGGLDVVDGRDLLLADDAETFAAAVIKVLEDPALAHRLGASGRAVFEANHGPVLFAQTVKRLSRQACDGGADTSASISVDGSVGGGADRRSDGSARLDITQVVLTRRFAGIERHVTTMAAALAARGHQVRIICPDPDVMAAGFPSAVQRSTVELVAAETWRRAAWEVARRRHTDVVHTHSTGSLVAAVVGLVGRSTSLVVTRHFTSVRWSDADGQGRRIARLRDPGLGQAQPGRIRAAVQRWVDSRIDQQVAVSTFVADNIAQPARVIHPGITAPARRVPAAQRQQRVLVLQRLEPNKATDVALRAWAASDLRHHGWMLDVVGDGSLRHALEDLVVELGLEGSVVMHGHVADVASLLDRAALLLAPAASEPFGLSVVEAMAAGVPVVAAGSGGHLETLGRVYGAGLFAPGDAAGAGALMDRLGPDVDVRQRLADAQCAVQQQYFDLHGQVAVMEGFYRHLARG
jgi:glycosyltransferase involved in cell wall biosynthesis